MSAKQKIVHRRGLSNLNLGIFVRSFDVYRASQPVPSRENEGTEREAPGPALGICHVHESYFKTSGSLPRRPHAGQPRSDV